MAKTTVTSAFDPMTAAFDVFQSASEDTGVHTQFPRLASGFQLVTNTHPKYGEYQAAQYGQRELALFKKGRADLMTYAVMVNGSVQIPVLTARADVPGGRISYFIGADGLDHLCTVRSYGPAQNKVQEYVPFKRTTSHNPEAIDRETGFAKEDYAGGIVRTIQYELLMSEGEAYQDVPEPANSFEKGCYLLGASIQRGGYWGAKSQVNKWAKNALPAGSTFPSEVQGVHFLEFLGHMAQKALTPVAWFVKPVVGWQTLTLEEQSVYKTPFFDGTKCYEAWTNMVLSHKNFGIVLKFGKTS